MTKIIEKEDILLSVKKNIELEESQYKIFQTTDQDTKKICYSEIRKTIRLY